MRLGIARFLQNNLKKRPIITNSLVYGTFYTAAEISQQTFNRYWTKEKPDYDPAAGLRIVFVGSSLYAPILYHWYNFLDHKYVGNAPKIVITKVCADQFVMTPMLLAAFFILLGILEGKEDIFEELKHKYWRAFAYNQMFWIPVQSVNFYMIPPHFRVVYVAAMSFIWINCLCFIKREKH